MHQLCQFLQLVCLHDLLRQVVFLHLPNLIFLGLNKLPCLLDAHIKIVGLVIVFQLNCRALLALGLLNLPVQYFDVIVETANLRLNVLLPEYEVNHPTLDSEDFGLNHFAALQDLLKGLCGLLVDNSIVVGCLNEILIGYFLCDEGVIEGARLG